LRGGGKKVANRTSHRSTTYPCFLPDLGEFSRSWSCRFAGAKMAKLYLLCNCISELFYCRFKTLITSYTCCIFNYFI